MQVPAALTMEGVKLTLNGASVRKRSYFKPDVVALYLSNKAANLDEAMRMPGPKKVRVWVLREFSGSVISRFFLGDFKQVATDDRLDTGQGPDVDAERQVDFPDAHQQREDVRDDLAHHRRGRRRARHARSPHGPAAARFREPLTPGGTPPSTNSCGCRKNWGLSATISTARSMKARTRAGWATRLP